VRRKSLTSNPSPVERGTDNLCTAYHVCWRVNYEPGEVKAVSRKDGKTVCEQVIRTAGQPDHIRLSVDYQGKELTFITAEVVDAQGNLCPWAEDQLVFSVSGGSDAQIVATDNGCQTSMERLRVSDDMSGMKLTSPSRKVFHGKCLIVVKGSCTLHAQSFMLKPANISLHTQKNN